jgi:hypothetical protein
MTNVKCHILSHQLDSSEALKYAGALEYVPEENMEQIQKVKKSVVDVVDRFRIQVRRRLNPSNVREAFNTAIKRDKMATFGFAAGCFVGCVL